MFDFLQKRPYPDFEVFQKVIQGNTTPRKVHQVELLIDKEVMAYISYKYLDEIPLDPARAEKKDFLRWYVHFWYRLGYDYAEIMEPDLTGFSFPSKRRIAHDTAFLAREKREWLEEGKGVIQSREDFEAYPWPEMKHLDWSPLEWLSEILPEGMKVLVSSPSGVFETVCELLGLEGMSYLLYEDYPLVRAVFGKIGEILCEYYTAVISSDAIGGIFHGDDMGYKTSTIVAPRLLQELVLPWDRKYAALAHEYGKVFLFHSCGNIFALMDEFINDVGIDAYHSFQDEIMPIWEFKEKFGDRVGYLGGVDVNRLCLDSEKALRLYVREILARCFPGRFAIGTGNSVANYIPPEKYLIMLEEAYQYWHTV